VGVVVLLIVGAVVALVVLSGGDDDDPETATDTDRTTVSVPSTEDPGSTDSSPSTPSTELPPSSEGPASTDSLPFTTPSLPGGGTSAPPDAFPDPPGARESITGGIEVPGTTAQEVAAFYEAELPGAGYTVDRVDDVGGTFAITVSGPDEGILSIVAVGPLPTTVIWTGL
jgi:hypothetical protein